MSNSSVTSSQAKNLGALAGVVTVVIVAFYVTGLYRNYLEIKKLKKDEKDSNG